MLFLHGTRIDNIILYNIYDKKKHKLFINSSFSYILKKLLGINKRQKRIFGENVCF